MDSPSAQVRELARRRAQARSDRDFVAADALRAQIEDLGWQVADASDGYSLQPLRGYEVLPGLKALPKLPAQHGQKPAHGLAAPRGLNALRGLDAPHGLAAARGLAATRGPGRAPAGDRQATVALLVQGWPDDLRECVGALLEHAPAGVMIACLDLGNADGAGDVLHELASGHRDRIEEWHVPAGSGWGEARTAMLEADPAGVHVIMETSTILTGDALGPLLAAVREDGVAAAGWRGADPDPDQRSFHDAGPGRVTALLGYLLAVRTEAALQAGGLPAQARFYRNADLEFSLRLGAHGALVVPPGPLPVRQARHRGYHDSDPAYGERESRRNYSRVLELLRGGGPPASS
jgi:hypothetical protein